MSNENEIRRALGRELDGVRADEGLRRRVLLRLEEAGADGSAADASAETVRRVPRADGRRARLLRAGAPLLLIAAVFAASVLALARYGRDDGAGQAAASIAQVPSYVPAGYAMTEVETLPRSGAEPEVVLRYADAAGTDVLELSRSGEQADDAREQRLKSAGYERQELDGLGEVWVKRLDADTLEVVWLDGKYKYKLSGKLAESDALKMAGSMTVRLKEEKP